MITTLIAQCYFQAIDQVERCSNRIRDFRAFSRFGNLIFFFTSYIPQKSKCEIRKNKV